MRGAFTGAQSDRAGLLKSADGGLLFLDQIGELGPDEQAMPLRAIEDKRFPPLGGDREVESDFQLIAGTNHDLAVAVREGRFRDDLFARLNLSSIHLPGLKERNDARCSTPAATGVRQRMMAIGCGSIWRGSGLSSSAAGAATDRDDRDSKTTPDQ